MPSVLYRPHEAKLFLYCDFPGNQIVYRHCVVYRKIFTQFPMHYSFRAFEDSRQNTNRPVMVTGLWSGDLIYGQTSMDVGTRHDERFVVYLLMLSLKGRNKEYF